MDEMQMQDDMYLSLVALSLSHVNPSTDLPFDTIDEAYEQAENFTLLGFEVSTPVPTTDGKYFITVSQ